MAPRGRTDDRDAGTLDEDRELLSRFCRQHGLEMFGDSDYYATIVDKQTRILAAMIRGFYGELD